MRCPNCKNRVLTQGPDGGSVLRIGGPLSFDSDGRARTKCHWCKAAITVPVTLTPQPETFVLPMKGPPQGPGSPDLDGSGRPT
jgi:hypothetical protein